MDKLFPLKKRVIKQKRRICVGQEISIREDRKNDCNSYKKYTKQMRCFSFSQLLKQIIWNYHKLASRIFSGTMTAMRLASFWNTFAMSGQRFKKYKWQLSLNWSYYPTVILIKFPKKESRGKFSEFNWLQDVIKTCRVTITNCLNINVLSIWWSTKYK